jgi:hypothetical protein
MAEVIHLSGKKINWNNPPRKTRMVQWSRRTTNGKRVVGSFRAIAHLNRVNNLAKRRYGKEIEVLQGPYNNTVAASAGTHDFDMVFDVYIPGVSWWEQQRFFRANGFAAWYRYPPKFGNHIHMISLVKPEGRDRADDFQARGFKVGKYVDGGYSTAGSKITSSQVEDYYEHKSGLSGHAHDRSWHPLDHGGVAKTIFDLGRYIKRRQSK